MIAILSRPRAGLSRWALPALLAGTAAHSSDSFLSLPGLSDAESWALWTVLLIGLCAWSTASLVDRRPARAANDDAALGRGGAPFPIAD